MTYDSFMQSLEHDSGCDRTDADGCLECVNAQCKCPICTGWAELCLSCMDDRSINGVNTPMCGACAVAYDRLGEIEFLKYACFAMLPPGA